MKLKRILILLLSSVLLVGCSANNRNRERDLSKIREAEEASKTGIKVINPLENEPEAVKEEAEEPEKTTESASEVKEVLEKEVVEENVDDVNMVQILRNSAYQNVGNDCVVATTLLDIDLDSIESALKSSEALKDKYNFARRNSYVWEYQKVQEEGKTNKKAFVTSQKEEAVVGEKIKENVEEEKDLSLKKFNDLSFSIHSDSKNVSNVESFSFKISNPTDKDIRKAILDNVLISSLNEDIANTLVYSEDTEDGIFSKSLKTEDGLGSYSFYRENKEDCMEYSTIYSDNNVAKVNDGKKFTLNANGNMNFTDYNLTFGDLFDEKSINLTTNENCILNKINTTDETKDVGFKEFAGCSKTVDNISYLKFNDYFLEQSYKTNIISYDVNGDNIGEFNLDYSYSAPEGEFVTYKATITDEFYELEGDCKEKALVLYNDLILQRLSYYLPNVDFEGYDVNCDNYSKEMQIMLNGLPTTINLNINTKLVNGNTRCSVEINLNDRDI